jgi:hypothetical protein
VTALLIKGSQQIKLPHQIKQGHTKTLIINRMSAICNAFIASINPRLINYTHAGLIAVIVAVVTYGTAIAIAVSQMACTEMPPEITTEEVYLSTAKHYEYVSIVKNQAYSASESSLSVDVCFKRGREVVIEASLNFPEPRAQMADWSRSNRAEADRMVWPWLKGLGTEAFCWPGTTTDTSDAIGALVTPPYAGCEAPNVVMDWPTDLINDFCGTPGGATGFVNAGLNGGSSDRTCGTPDCTVLDKFQGKTGLVNPTYDGTMYEVDWCPGAKSDELDHWTTITTHGLGAGETRGWQAIRDKFRLCGSPLGIDHDNGGADIGYIVSYQITKRRTTCPSATGAIGSALGLATYIEVCALP